MRWPGVLRKRKKSKAPDGRYTRAGQPLPVAGLSGLIDRRRESATGRSSLRGVSHVERRPRPIAPHQPGVTVHRERHPKGSLERRDHGLQERESTLSARSPARPTAGRPTPRAPRASTNALTFSDPLRGALPRNTEAEPLRETDVRIIRNSCKQKLYHRERCEPGEAPKK